MQEVGRQCVKLKSTPMYCTLYIQKYKSTDKYTCGVKTQDVAMCQALAATATDTPHSCHTHASAWSSEIQLDQHQHKHTSFFYVPQGYKEKQSKCSRVYSYCYCVALHIGRDMPCLSEMSPTALQLGPNDSEDGPQVSPKLKYRTNGNTKNLSKNHTNLVLLMLMVKVSRKGLML